MEGTPERTSPDEILPEETSVRRATDFNLSFRSAPLPVCLQGCRYPLFCCLDRSSDYCSHCFFFRFLARVGCLVSSVFFWSDSTALVNLLTLFCSFLISV